MVAVPTPRRPRCLRHHIWHVDCDDCNAQRKAERQAAQQRLDQAAR